MSTRAQIAFEGTDIMIYKHSDGYPEGVTPILVPFLEHFFQNRGWDPEYLIAQTIRAFAFEDVPYMAENPDMSDHLRTLGWGISTIKHSDIEYLYLISRDGTLKVFSVEKADWDIETERGLLLSEMISCGEEDIV